MSVPADVVDDLLEEPGPHDGARRVVRIVEEHELRARPVGVGDRHEVRREAALGQQRHEHGVGAGQQRAAGVDGVAGVGAQRAVARVEEGEVEVEDALLGADRRHDLGLRVELDVEAAHVEVRHRLAEVLAAAVGRVLVRLGLGDGLLHRVDDDRGRRPVGIADAQRDDVDALRALGGDLALELGEQVGRDEVEALAGLHRFSSSVQKSSASSPRYTGRAQPVRSKCRSSPTSTTSSPPSSLTVTGESPPRRT